MRAFPYLVGVPVTLESDLPPPELSRVVNRTAATVLLSLLPGVAGWAVFNHVRLRVRSIDDDYSAKPVLAGRIIAAGPGSRLQLRYRLAAKAVLFYGLWYLILGALPFFGMVDDWSTAGIEVQAALAFVYLFLLFVPFPFHRAGIRRSQGDLQFMLRFLDKVAGARPVEPSPGVERGSLRGLASVTLLLSLFAGLVAAPSRAAVPTAPIRELLFADSDVPRPGKLALAEGTIDRGIQRFTLANLSIFQPVLVAVVADRGSGVRVKLGKYGWDDEARSGAVDSGGRYATRFRTQGDLLITLQAPESPTGYKLAVWAGSEVRPDIAMLGRADKEPDLGSLPALFAILASVAGCWFVIMRRRRV